MNSMTEKLINDIKKRVEEALRERISSDELDKVAKVIYGTPEPLVPGDESSTQVSPPGIDAIKNAIMDSLDDLKNPEE